MKLCSTYNTRQLGGEIPAELFGVPKSLYP